MARIPEPELERLRSGVDLTRLVESDGHDLKRIGKDLACVCPFHAGDREPSLIVSPAKNLFHCFACGAAGSPIDWLMKRRGVAFRRAVELLRAEAGGIGASAAEVPKAAASRVIAPLAPGRGRCRSAARSGRVLPRCAAHGAGGAGVPGQARACPIRT